MKAGELFWIWTGYIVELSILILSVQPSKVSDRAFFGPTMCRANGNEVSAINLLTLKLCVGNLCIFRMLHRCHYTE